jgi:hypothetical protein
MHEFVVFVPYQVTLGEKGARNEMAPRRGRIAETDRLSLDVFDRFDRTVGLGDDDASVGWRSLRDADGERLDVGSLRFCQHVGQRPEIGDLDASEAHRFDHR